MGWKDEGLGWKGERGVILCSKERETNIGERRETGRREWREFKRFYKWGKRVGGLRGKGRIGIS